MSLSDNDYPTYIALLMVCYLKNCYCGTNCVSNYLYYTMYPVKIQCWRSSAFIERSGKKLILFAIRFLKRLFGHCIRELVKNLRKVSTEILISKSSTGFFPFASLWSLMIMCFIKEIHSTQIETPTFKVGVSIC